MELISLIWGLAPPCSNLFKIAFGSQREGPLATGAASEHYNLQ